MGGCGSAAISPEDREKYRIAKKLDQQLQQDLRVEEEKLKLLLLGAGESGKSTVFKQMKIIYGTEYTDDEKRAQIPTISGNILQAMKILLRQVRMFQMQEDVQCKAEYEQMMTVEDDSPIDAEICRLLKTLWVDPAIQTAWQRRSEFQIIESLEFYLSRIDAIAATDYLPSKDDIIHMRVRTSGIVTERYTIDNAVFEIYDVGGQRNERKKWIHCFEGVTAVIFVVGLSEYDQKLYEDATTNRMVEALSLFDEIVNSPYFQDSAMIVFFNKKDLFEQKIKVKNIRDIPAFKDYTGPDHDYQAGVDYFVKRFFDKNHNASRSIYSHITCATDTENVHIVFNACKEIVLKENIRTGGMYME